MRVDLLNRLIDLLERDAAKPNGVKFDMAFWAKVAGKDRYSFTAENQPTVDCGTNACALGLAAISGEFKDVGLGYKIDSGALEPTLENYEGFEVGAQLFDISKSDAFVLFDPIYYPFNLRKGAEAEREVIKRIQHLIYNGNLMEYPTDT